MSKKILLRGSLILNVIFIIVFAFLGFTFRGKIFQKFFYSKKSKIVLLGDSNTKLCNWNELLKRDDVKNSGVGGATTSDFILTIDENVLSYNPEICFIQGGINDIIYGASISRITFNYKSIIDTLLKRKITPVVQSTFYQEDNFKTKILVDSLNRFLFEYCTKNKIYYLDINSKLSSKNGLKPEYSKDGTHVSQEAYIVWCREIFSQLEIIEKSKLENAQ